jgi:hypothetical protein
MKVIERANATGNLAEYAAEIDKGAIIVTNQAQPVGALMPIENTDLETASLNTNRQFLELIERSRSPARTEGVISSEEMRRRFS